MNNLLAKSLLSAALLWAVPAHAEVSVVIAAGDSAALASAFADAAGGAEPTRILLAAGGRYVLEAPMTASATRIRLVGNGATVVPRHELGFVVGAGAELAIDSMFIDGEGKRPGTQLFRNAGALTLEAVSVTRVAASVSAPLVENLSGAHMRWSNVSFVGNLALCTGILRGCISSQPVLRNGGEFVLEHVSWVRNLHWIPEAELPGATVRVRNSILDDSLGFTFCPPSEGGNVLAFCAGADDQAITDQLAFDGELTLRGGLIPTLAPLPGNPALGAASACLGSDARGARRIGMRCDAGAFETGGVLGDDRLEQGNGLTGVYYDPGNDGHYIQLQRIGVSDVLLTWMHFDRDRSPAWVYLVASPANGRLAGTALRNVATPSVGDVAGGTATTWGSLSLHLLGCDSVQLDYDSAELGAGSVTLQRLTVLEGVGCRESDASH